MGCLYFVHNCLVLVVSMKLSPGINTLLLLQKCELTSFVDFT